MERTLTHIFERTHSPYRLIAVDDGSDDVNDVHLVGRQSIGYIDTVILQRMRCGAMAAQNAGIGASFSDPVVLVDDDILCPDIDPDWLSRGLAAMKKHKNLAMLALNHPGAKHKALRKDGNVTFCRSVGATFAFCRREFLLRRPLPHELGKLDRPMEMRCKLARANNWQIGYLTEVYCYHIGKKSILTGKDYKGRFIEPENWNTLEPPREWRI